MLVVYRKEFGRRQTSEWQPTNASKNSAGQTIPDLFVKKPVPLPVAHNASR
jgi:hypothetical protein